MKSCLIISRYRENIDWINYNDFDKVLIYNKGDNLTKDNVIDLPNVGRESHTWLHHIVENYNNLYENNIFLQGRIDDLGCMVFSDPREYINGIKKNGFSVKRLGLLGPFHWKHNIGIEKDPRYKESWERGEISKSKIGFRKFAKKYFPEIPKFVATSYGGCFGVSKEFILLRDLKFYRKLLENLSKSKNPIEGHYMERLWCYLFTKNRFLPRACKDVLKTKLERRFDL